MARLIMFGRGILPKNRRDLQLQMVQDAVGHLWEVFIRLKLFSRPTALSAAAQRRLFAITLFKLVSKRHTHLWNKASGQYER